MSGAGLLSIEWEIADQHLPMPHIVATACAAFVEEAERRGLVIRSGPSPLRPARAQARQGHGQGRQA